MDPTNLRADGVTSREQKQPETELAPLTPSEVALAKILAAWDEYQPTAADYHVWRAVLQAIGATEIALFDAGFARRGELTPAGQALLARARAAGILRPRDGSPAWAAIGEIAATLGLAEDAPTQDVIDAVKNERGILAFVVGDIAKQVAFASETGAVPVLDAIETLRLLRAVLHRSTTHESDLAGFKARANRLQVSADNPHAASLVFIVDIAWKPEGAK